MKNSRRKVLVIAVLVIISVLIAGYLYLVVTQFMSLDLSYPNL